MLGVILLLTALVYIGLNSSYVLTRVSNALTKGIEKETDTEINIKKVRILPFKKIVLSGVGIHDHDKDTLLFVDKITANIDDWSLRRKSLNIGALTLMNAKVIYEQEGESYNFEKLVKYFSKIDTSAVRVTKLKLDKIHLLNATLKTNLITSINGSEVPVQFDQINLSLANLFTAKDSLIFNVNRLNFKSIGNIHLRDLSCSFSYIDSVLAVNELKAKSNYSELLIDSLNVDMGKYLKTRNVNHLKTAVYTEQIRLGSSDLAGFVKTFDGNNLVADFSGEISGYLNELRGRDIKMSLENFTRLNGDFYINGLPDISTAYIFFNLNESYANLNEIRNLNLPVKIRSAIEYLPRFMDNVGEFRYKGNFTGFLDNFVAYGTAYSEIGTLSTDVSFEPSKNKSLKMKGSVSGEKLNIGRIFQNDKLNELSFSGVLNGTISENDQYNISFEGAVDQIDYNAYRYENVQINGALKNEQFNGKLAINDRNIKLDYSGMLDLASEIPVFNFNAQVKDLRPDSLNLFEDLGARVSFNMNANFEGNNIDNVNGILLLTDLSYRNMNDSVSIDSIEFRNLPGKTKLFELRSDFADGRILGEYNFLSIRESLIKYYQQYLSNSFQYTISELEFTSDFEFDLMLKDLSYFTRLFQPDLNITKNIELSGYYEPSAKNAFFETNIPYITYGGRGMEDITIRLLGDDEKLDFRMNTSRIRFSDHMNIYNLTLAGEGKDNVLDFDVFWSNFDDITYSGSIKTSTRFEKTNSRYPHVVVTVEPTKMYFADSLWQMDQTSIQVDSSSIKFDQFRFHNMPQEFLIDGNISELPDDRLNVEMNGVDLALFEPLMGRLVFDGKIKGSAEVSDIYGLFKMDMQVAIEELFYNDGFLGKLALDSKWDKNQEKLASNLSLSKENKKLIDARGHIDPLEAELDLLVHLDQSPASILEVFMPSTFNKQSGLLNGDIHLTGKTKNIKLFGTLKPEDQTQIGLSYLNTVYSLSDPIRFNRDSILFDDLMFFDSYGNQAILDGYITHKTFNKMKYNLAIETEHLLALNTTAADNAYFYGKAFVGGDLLISGAGTNVLISGDIISKKGTSLNIPFETSASAEEYDFIKFTGGSNYNENVVNYDVVTSGLSMDFDAELTPDAKMQIIFNSQVGDVIKASGNGNLQVKVDKDYKISLYGNYVIEEGDYLFTLQNVINKRFEINRGSTLEWAGDPYNAKINIGAVYKVKTNLRDLFVGTYENIDMSRRIPVDCKISLTESLLQPKVKFDIELPTAEERVKDEVSQLIATPEQTNKQVISLLMMGRFYTPEFFAGTPTVETSGNIVGTTASELISNQLTNWLSQISDIWDIGINYRPGNEITDNQVELVLSTQILNDRVTLNGNIANNANPNSTNNSDFIGDFDVNIKLTEKGKLQFKAYNHSNDNLIYDTAPYTQGIGFTYREDFNSFEELLNRYKAILSRKKKVSTSAEDPAE